MDLSAPTAEVELGALGQTECKQHVHVWAAPWLLGQERALHGPRLGLFYPIVCLL